MSDISTTCSGGDVNTPSGGAGGGTWAQNHVTNLTNAFNSGDFVLTGRQRIYTTWPIGGGQYKTTTTVRLASPPGETDAEFLSRHIDEFLSDMANYPPVP